MSPLRHPLKASRKGRLRSAVVEMLIPCLLFQFTTLGLAQKSFEGRERPSLKPVVTRQTTFTIPFQTNNTTQSIPQAIEVQLHVSRNGGVRWQLYSREHPTAGSFRFHAPTDGHYWYAVRTVDGQGRHFPRRVEHPELLVIVDTDPPTINLLAKVGTTGDVQTRWEVADLQLDVASLRLEYQAEPNAEWQPVAIDRSKSSSSSTVISGNARWWPRTETGQIQVRARVNDFAGNASTIQRKIDLTRVAGRRLRPIPPELAEHRPDGGVAWRAEQGLTSEVVDRNHRSTDGRALEQGKSNQAMTSLTRVDQSKNVRRTADFSPSVYGEWAKTQSSEESQGVNQLASDRKIVKHPEDFDEFLPVRLHVTRFRRFSLDYDVDSVGTSGVRTVHLWGTLDQGQTWAIWGKDDDRNSPVEVNVSGEGLFGFRIIVENNEGLSLRIPQPGDAPDVHVRVDQTKPEAELMSAQYGHGDHAGQLEIRWKARDEHLGERPVTLTYASDPMAGWQTIAENIANTGIYSWRIDRHVPRQVFLRIEVSDQAGNQSLFELPDPVSTRGLVPRGRIRGVRPLPDIHTTVE